MFDNLRDQASANSALPDEGGPGALSGFDEPQPRAATTSGRVFGMTAPQRLVLAILLLLTVCVLGTMCLLVTGRIGTF